MIDLMKQYGKRYKVTMDESWDVERDRKQEDKPWYYEIVGRKGYAYPQGTADQLAFEIKRSIWGRFERSKPFPYILVRHGDDFMKILVSEEHIDKALRFIVPRRRKQLSDTQRLELAERMKILRLKLQAGKRSGSLEPVQDKGDDQ